MRFYDENVRWYCVSKPNHGPEGHLLIHVFNLGCWWRGITTSSSTENQLCRQFGRSCFGLHSACLEAESHQEWDLLKSAHKKKKKKKKGTEKHLLIMGTCQALKKMQNKTKCSQKSSSDRSFTLTCPAATGVISSTILVEFAVLSYTSSCT